MTPHVRRAWIALAVSLTAAMPCVSPTLADDAARLVDLFEAMKTGEIEVEVIPRGTERITLAVKNRLNQPLRIRAPDAAVAAPLAAPVPPAGRATPAPPQALGIAFPGPGLNNAQPPDFGPFEGGVMSVPAGRTIKVRLPAVCLEYHKHEPRAGNRYELRPFENFSTNEALRELVIEFGSGRFSQPAVQVAAWHLADKLTFRELAEMRTQNEAGRTVHRFRPEEIAEAEELVAGLPAVKRKEAGGKEAGGK